MRKEVENKDLKDKIFFNRFKIKSKIGEGSFGRIYEGININNGVKIAVKLEEKSTNQQLLENEANILYLLKGYGVPELYSYGYSGKYNVLVESLLGKSLDKLYTENRFSLKDTAMIGIQVYQRISYIHYKGIIHRDIKPDNFAISNPNKKIINILDFGLSKKYRDDEGNHIPFRVTRRLTGTARFASANALRGYEQSRRDDLESIAYMLIYFMKGKLPWQGIEAKTKQERYQKIYNLKKYLLVHDICENLPIEFETILTYSKSLSFEEDPDYNYLVNLMDNILFKFDLVKNFCFSWCNEFVYSKINKKQNDITNETKREITPCNNNQNKALKFGCCNTNYKNNNKNHRRNYSGKVNFVNNLLSSNSFKNKNKNNNKNNNSKNNKKVSNVNIMTSSGNFKNINKMSHKREQSNEHNHNFKYKNKYECLYNYFKTRENSAPKNIITERNNKIYKKNNIALLDLGEQIKNGIANLVNNTTTTTNTINNTINNNTNSKCYQYNNTNENSINFRKYKRKRQNTLSMDGNEYRKNIGNELKKNMERKPKNYTNYNLSCTNRKVNKMKLKFDDLYIDDSCKINNLNNFNFNNINNIYNFDSYKNNTNNNEEFSISRNNTNSKPKKENYINNNKIHVQVQLNKNNNYLVTSAKDLNHCQHIRTLSLEPQYKKVITYINSDSNSKEKEDKRNNECESLLNEGSKENDKNSENYKEVLIRNNKLSKLTKRLNSIDFNNFNNKLLNHPVLGYENIANLYESNNATERNISNVKTNNYTFKNLKLCFNFNDNLDSRDNLNCNTNGNIINTNNNMINISNRIYNINKINNNNNIIKKNKENNNNNNDNKAQNKTSDKNTKSSNNTINNTNTNNKIYVSRVKGYNKCRTLYLNDRNFSPNAINNINANMNTNSNNMNYNLNSKDNNNTNYIYNINHNKLIYKKKESINNNVDSTRNSNKILINGNSKLQNHLEINNKNVSTNKKQQNGLKIYRQLTQTKNFKKSMIGIYSSTLKSINTKPHIKNELKINTVINSSLINSKLQGMINYNNITNSSNTKYISSINNTTTNNITVDCLRDNIENIKVNNEKNMQINKNSNNFNDYEKKKGNKSMRCSNQVKKYSAKIILNHKNQRDDICNTYMNDCNNNEFSGSDFDKFVSKEQMPYCKASNNHKNIENIMQYISTYN